MELPNALLVVFGNTFPHRSFLDEIGMEWDSERKIYAMYSHPFNAQDVQTVVNFATENNLTSKILTVHEYNSFQVQPQKTDDLAPLKEWLVKNAAGSSFYTSLLNQLNTRGTLSPRQIECVKKGMEKDSPVATAQPKAMENPTFANGTAVSVRKFFAEILKQKYNMSFSHRNIEIIETYRETDKAIEAKIRFTPRFRNSCCMCGRHLDTNISRASGIGPICAEKFGIDQMDSMSAKEIIESIELKMKSLGEITTWIPRSAIKQVIDEAATAA